MRDLMIDLESYATTPDAVIWSVGACYFDRETGEIIKSFYMHANPNCKYNIKRLRTTSTLKFWSEQSDDAQIELEKAKESLNSLLDVVINLGRFMHANNPDAEIWANGTTFDISALEHVYKQVGLPVPWKYNAMSDMRTLHKLNLVDPATIPDTNVAHHALYDAIWQAEYTSRVLQQIERLKTLDSKADWL